MEKLDHLQDNQKKIKNMFDTKEKLNHLQDNQDKFKIILDTKENLNKSGQVNA